MSTTILIADDKPGNRELLVALLRPHGYKLLLAEDGQGALDLFCRYHPDLVLLDVVMPKMNGLDACRLMKAHPDSRLIPVILVTALSAVEDRIAGIDAGADDFLTKPVDGAELLSRVRSLLSLKAHTDELERADAVLLALARTIEAKDPYTDGHCD